MNLRSMLMRSHLLICIIPVLVIALVFYYTIYTILASETENHVNQLLSAVTQNLEGIFEESEKTATLLEHEISLQQALREPPSPFTSGFYAFNLRMDDWLRFIYSYSTTRLDAFYILGRYVQFKSNELSFSNDTFINEAWFTNTVNSETSLWFGTHEGSFVNEGEGRFVTMTKVIRHTLNDSILGVVLIDIKAETIHSAVLADGFSEGSSIYILSRRDELIASSGDQAYRPEQAPRFGTLSFERPLSNGWTLYANVPVLPTIVQKMGTTTSAVLVVMLLVILLISFMSYRLSRSISTPIDNLMYAMKEVETGHFDAALTSRSSAYEIQNLYKSFNIMVERLETLIRQSVEEQKNLRKAQLSALQSQINPHFLYNTLDTITWNVRLGRSEEAITALIALTRFFRISISKGHNHISISEEIDHARMYLNIQRMRYNDRLDFDIEMNPAIASYRTIKLILQPLVENAIYHGIKEVDRQGMILIRALEDGGDILLTVRDNGKGMSPEELDALNQLLAAENTVDDKAYGVLNVNTRIRMEYGGRYGLSYESARGEYTLATIRLPKIPMTGEAGHV